MSPNRTLKWTVFILRFLCLPLMWYHAIISIKHHNTLKFREEKILAPPLSRQIDFVEYVALIVGLTGCNLNQFLMMIQPLAFQRYFWLFIGVTDVAYFLSLAYITGVESAQIWDHKVPRCQSLTSLPTEDTEDKTLLFFSRMHKYADYQRYDYCESFRDKFAVLIVLLLLLGLVMLITLVSAINACLTARQEEFVHKYVVDNDVAKAVRRWIRSAPRLFLTAILFPYKAVVHCLQAGRKSIKVKDSSVELKLLEAGLKHGSVESPIYKALNYDLLVMVARHLHFGDLVNLSMASKQMRALIFHHSASSSSDKARMKLYTCNDQSRSDCPACGVQICNHCSYVRRHPRATPSAHVELCEPLCLRCNLANAVDADCFECKCYDRRLRTFRQQAYFYNSPIEYLLCQDCILEDLDKVTNKIEEREMRQLKGFCGTEQESSCASCTQPLQGSVWWRCKKCKGGCFFRNHRSWG